MDGFVSLISDAMSRRSIKIWRDSGAFQSLILQDVLQFSDQSAVGSNAIVERFGGGHLSLPMHNLNLESALVSGQVSVCVCSHIPIKGVSFILGNDLAGGRVLVAPEVVPRRVAPARPDELDKKYPGTFSVCVTNRAMSKRTKEKALDPEMVLADTLLAKEGVLGFGKVFPSREELKVEQQKDATLTHLFEEAVPEEKIGFFSCGYFINYGILMRKWTSPKMSCEDDWSSVFQIIVPSSYRFDILQLAHDHCLAGHMGIRKTLDRVCATGLLLARCEI